MVYGAGPIGRWLALRMLQAQQDVTLLARGVTFDALQRRGIGVEVCPLLAQAEHVDTEVRFGLHAKTVGPELRQLASELEALKAKTAAKTPTLDAPLAAIPAAAQA